MSAYTTPGVYMIEKPDTTRTISGVSTSITAFIGPAVKGPLTPRTIFSWSEFQRVYGGLWKKSEMSYAAYHFFQNGGSEAVIIRIFQEHQALDDEGDPISDEDGNVTFVSGTAKFYSFEKQIVNGETITFAAIPDLDEIFQTKDPGKFAKNFQIEINRDDIPDEEATNFNLRIYDKINNKEVVIETHLNLSIDHNNSKFFRNIIDQRSNYITTIKEINPPPDNFRAFLRAGKSDEINSLPNDGVLDDDYPITSGFTLEAIKGENMITDIKSNNKKGLKALEDDVEIFNMLCIPPYNKNKDVDPGIYDIAIQICEKRNAMLLVDPLQDWTDITKATDNLTVNQSANTMKFFPFLQIRDPLKNNTVRDFVPCGAVAGVIARTDTERGVWKSPAGLGAKINGIEGLNIKLTEGEQGKLNSKGINALVFKPTSGYVIWGARTTKGLDVLSDPFKYLAVRRMFLFIKESIYRGSEWIVFEPNDEKLWAQIRVSLKGFMHNLFRKGAFQGSSPDEAYFVKCDSETTTQFDIDSGIVNILVAFAPLKPAEFVVFTMSLINKQNEGGT